MSSMHYHSLNTEATQWVHYGFGDEEGGGQVPPKAVVSFCFTSKVHLKCAQ